MIGSVLKPYWRTFDAFISRIYEFMVPFRVFKYDLSRPDLGGDEVKKTKLAEVITPQDCAVILRAVGDPTRIRILESLLTKEKCVGDLVLGLKRPQPQISQHLRVLRQVGLIEGLREGKQIYYQIVPHLRPVLKTRKEQTLNFGCCQLSFPVSLSET